MDVQTPVAEPSYGASFGEIATEAPVTEAPTATPDPVVEEAEPAKDGGQDDEPLGILKDDDPKDEDEDGVDLAIDPDLERHPVLKAKWEAYKAQKERGIQKFIEDHKSKVAEIESFKTEWEPLVREYQRFNEGPDEALRAYQEFGQRLEAYYKIPFNGGHASQSEEAQQAGSKYGLEFDSDDKVVDVVLDRVGKMFDERFGKLEPVLKDHESRAQEAQRAEQAKAALPSIQAEHQTSAKPWVDVQMVESAMKRYPNLAPDEAFALAYRKEIAKYVAEHSQGSSAQKVRPLPTGMAGGAAQADLRHGATFGEIARSEGTL